MLLDVTTEDATVAFIAETTRSRRYTVITTPNVNDLIGSSRSMAWRRALLTSSLSTADGMPLVWIARLLGLPIRKRLAGADIFEALRAGRAGPLSVVFYGGAPGIAATAQDKINAERGALTVVGSVDPGFGSVEELGRSHLIDEVNALDADVLALSLGAKGKLWIDSHSDKILRGTVIHLGAVINFAAGSVRRAPLILRNSGLEWVWRIIEEPSLWRRYTFDGLQLLWLLVTRVIPLWFDGHFRSNEGRGRKGNVVEAATIDSSTVHIIVVGPLDSDVLDSLRSSCIEAAEQRLDIIIDLEQATDLDTVAAGFLLLVFGMQSRLQRSIKVVRTSSRVRKQLKWHGCVDIFASADAHG